MSDGAATEATGPIRSAGAMHAPPDFESIFRRHGAELHRYAMRLTRNPADADDLYQETFLKAFRAFGRLDGDANHRAWLYKIATNTYFSHQRKLGRIEALADDAPIAAPSRDHAAELDARALLDEVERFVTCLPPKQRVALILRKYHEMGYDEIALNLGSSEAAARANVHEALRKLRTAFEDRL